MRFEVILPDVNPDINTDYDLGDAVGRGAFGVVRLATDRRTKEVLACKSISKARLVSPEEIADVRTEIDILKFLTPHKTLAGIRGVYEDRDYVHIVMDYCAGGELFDRIISKGTFSEAEAARFFRQMVEMVAHCHSCRVMHRDIKPENFLLSDKTDNAELLACDFGLGTFFVPGRPQSVLVGSPYYVAPEVLRRRYGPEADIWSLGVVLYILLSGIPPFWGATDKEIFSSILKGQLDLETSPWPQISDAAKDLIKKVLTVDPTRRPTVSEMLSHPWLKEQGVASDAPLDSLVVNRMRGFAAMTKLRKAAVLIAAQHLSHDEINGLKQLFKSFDTNGDGHITKEELRKGLRSSGGNDLIGESDLESVMENADVDGSGAIDYEEFLAATVNLRLLEREDVLRKLFRELDEDSSGTLTIDEIEKKLNNTAVGPIDHEEILEMIKRADTNGDGVIDFDEFVAEWKQAGAGGVAHAAKALKRGLPSDVDTQQLA